MTLPFIDISIVTYNSSRWFDNFVGSLLKQNYPTHLINILLTDNQSSDNTIELCHTFLLKYDSYFNSFKIFHQPNLGFGCGHNNNLKEGDATYFLVSNVDLEFSHNAIFEAVNTAILDDRDVASWEFRQKPFEHPKYYNPVTLETYWSSHACILFRRSALEHVKGYDDRIFLYGEDVELSYRLRDNGFRIKYCPSAVCWHYTYEYANQLKRSQFLGSILANSYIRLRYGSLKQIVSVPFMYLKLLISPHCIENQQVALLDNIYKLLKNTVYFLSTRKKSNKLFPINKWDYGFIRDGAFYSYSRQVTGALPLVSVIIRTYQGRLPYLQEAVTSVLNQTYSNIELIVVEDGSSDAKHYTEQVDKISKIKVIYKEEAKRGRCHTGNIGLSLATGKFIVFLDDDDLFFADHIEVLTNELLLHPEVSATYSIAWKVPTKLVSTEPLIYTETSHKAIHKQKFSRLLMLHHNYIPIQSILFDRKLYDRYGGFDESLENLEDWNLWTRYCLNDDFLLVEKTTSMYRVPDNLHERATRKESLDSYYKIAVERQKELELTVTREEVMKFHAEMVEYEDKYTSVKFLLKSLFFRYKYSRKLYYILSILKNKD